MDRDQFQITKPNLYLLAATLLIFGCVTTAAWGGLAVIGSPPTDPNAPATLPIDAYLLCMAVAFLGYFFLCWGILKQIDSNAAGRKFSASTAPAVLLLLIVLRLVVYMAPHRTNSDVWRYVWDGHLVVNGFNPWQFAPEDTALDGIRDPNIYDNLKPAYNNLRSVYGPVAMLGAAAVQFLPGDPVASFRLLATVCDIVTIFLLTVLLKRLNLPDVLVLFYAANPLLVDSFADRAHVDALMLPLLVAGFLAITNRYWIWAGFWLGLLCSVKISGLVLVPIWWTIAYRTGNFDDARRRNWIQFSGGLGVAMIFAVGPILWSGLTSLDGFAAYASRWRSNGSIGAILENVLGEPGRWISGVGCAAFVLTYSHMVLGKNLSNRSEQIITTEAAAGSLAGFSILLLFSPTVFPWYLTWMLPTLPLVATAARHHRWLMPMALAWSVLAMVWYLKFLLPPWDNPKVFPEFARLLEGPNQWIEEPWRIVEYLIVYGFFGCQVNAWRKREV